MQDIYVDSLDTNVLDTDGQPGVSNTDPNSWTEKNMLSLKQML